MKNPFDNIAAEFDIRIDHFSEVASTNDTAREGSYNNGDIIIADNQTQGRGQRGNRWESTDKKNLTFSMVLTPRFLKADRQFLLSETISLALTDTLNAYDIYAEVKWTNDIYVDGNKIAGILIENDIMGDTLWRSIVGIGLNVNQKKFSPELPNPTSMRLVKNRKFDRHEILSTFISAFKLRYKALEEGFCNGIEKDYHHRLFRIGKPHIFLLPDGTSFTGIIKHVQQSGELMIEHPDGSVKGYLFKEIAFSL